jgi:hypothetical protein
MRRHHGRVLITRAVHSNDPAQINALASRLAADERLPIALQAHGHILNGQPIDVVEYRALNVKACNE